MPNPYFSFKKFTVYHDKCAMKVGTDGVLLGAWADVADAETVLDIGVGSGLVSLMMAQRNLQARILGIDVDAAAVQQAGENVQNSPFAHRITVREISVQALAAENVSRFDSIVSNPPFFANSLKPPRQQRTLARHTDSLPLDALFPSVAGLLRPHGLFSMIYPAQNLADVLDAASQCGLFLQRQTTVYPTLETPPKRVLLEFSDCVPPTSVREESLLLEMQRHRYSSDFAELVKDFYLENRYSVLSK